VSSPGWASEHPESPSSLRTVAVRAERVDSMLPFAMRLLT
jgi:hypothetical protein